MVEVVELADRGDPRRAHLAEGLQAERLEFRRLQASDQTVHGLAPAPEAARAGREGLAASAQPALEGVRVRGDHARQEGAVFEAQIGRATEVADGFDAAVFSGGDLDVRLEAVAGPGEVGFEDGGVHAILSPPQCRDAPWGVSEAGQNGLFGEGAAAETPHGASLHWGGHSWSGTSRKSLFIPEGLFRRTSRSSAAAVRARQRDRSSAGARWACGPPRWSRGRRWRSPFPGVAASRRRWRRRRWLPRSGRSGRRGSGGWVRSRRGAWRGCPRGARSPARRARRRRGRRGSRARSAPRRRSLAAGALPARRRSGRARR